MGDALAAVRRRPPVLTLAFVVILAATWGRLEVGGQLPTLQFIEKGFSPRAILDGRYGVLLTSTLLCRDVFMVISICVSLLVTAGTYEVVAGHVRAACLALFAAAAAPLLVLGELSLLSALGSEWAPGRLETLDIGASAIVAASSGALAGLARRRILTVGLVLFLLGGLLLHHQLADWEHVSIFPIGYWWGRVFGTAAPPSARPARVAAGCATAWLTAVAGGLLVCGHILPPAPVYRSATGEVMSAPRVVQTEFPTPSTGGKRSVLVLLPPGYDDHDSTRRYPVIEVLHGNVGKPSTLMSLGDIAAAALAPGVAPFIALLPDGNDPGRPFAWWVNQPGHALGTAVTTDLHAWATRAFRTTGQWSFAGLSSGGFGAAYLPLVSTFAVHGVCGLSGYYNGRGSPDASAELHASSEPELVFVAYGVSDKLTRPPSERFVAALRAAGKRVIVKQYPGGHNWNVWRPAFRQCFQLLAPAT